MANRDGPHWVFIALGTLVLALVGATAAMGGPDDALLKTRAALWGQPPPKIISVELAPRSPKGSYIATLRNPALEDVVVTGYRATPLNLGISGDDAAYPANVSGALASDNGAVTIMGADEQGPESCASMRYVALPRPLIVEARSARALQIRPWKESCVFSITILSDHGESEPSLHISGFEE